LIYHIFKILPTSFVPNEDQGYAFAAIIMPQAASLARTQDITDKADEIFKSLPACRPARWSRVTACSTGGFKDQCSTIFVTFSDFDERYKNIDTAKTENVRAILQDFREGRLIEGAIVVPVARRRFQHRHHGGFEFWIQDTGTGDPVALDGVNAGLPQEGARAARTHRPGHDDSAARSSCGRTSTARQDAASGDSGPGRVQRDPGAIRITHGQPVQPVLQCLVGGRPVRCAISAEPEDLTRLYTRNNQNQMVPLSSVVTTQWTSGPDILPISTAHCGQDQRQRLRGYSRRRHRDNGSGGQGSVAARLHVRVVGLSYEEKKSGGTSGLAFVFASSSCSRAVRAVRIVDAAVP